ncbi:hypothetical protein ACMXYR_15130 [Neptuniibacter sp. QD29_5]|uniref:hypothetical protein n=1 Tax=Neptuniibacter sp. QD29_5 TaxID=3398207 RepID=UPI0039F5057B
MKYQLVVCIVLSLSAFSGTNIKAAVTKDILDSSIQYKVIPLSVNLSKQLNVGLYSGYARPLLKNLAERSIYRIKNGFELRGFYKYKGLINSSDRRKSILGFKKEEGAQWGYLTTSVAPQSSANAFIVQSDRRDSIYALVLKGVRICLVSKASGLPVWEEGKWTFAGKPGYFECTGSARSSIFNGRSEFPRLLGPYYSEGDTVLTFRKPQELKKVILSLKRQFPVLTVPALPNYEEAQHFVYRTY